MGIEYYGVRVKWPYTEQEGGKNLCLQIAPRPHLFNTDYDTRACKTDVHEVFFPCFDEDDALQLVGAFEDHPEFSAVYVERFTRGALPEMPETSRVVYEVLAKHEDMTIEDAFILGAKRLLSTMRYDC